MQWKIGVVRRRFESWLAGPIKARGVQVIEKMGANSKS